MATATMSPAEMLAQHREVWDMPTLMETAPEVLQHLHERYEVHFGLVSEVIVVHRDTGLPEHFTTTDVREVVVTLLEREIEKES